jgi:Flp pilus assembly protein TadG
MRRRNDRGSAVVEMAWLSVLLLVPLLWILLSVFEVQSGAFGTNAAARAAGRAYALAPDHAEGQRRAEHAARQALRDQGHDDVPLRIEISCTPYPHHCHSGTSVITVQVFTRVGLPFLPDLFGLGEPTFALDATHTVPIGQYQEVAR